MLTVLSARKIVNHVILRVTSQTHTAPFKSSSWISLQSLSLLDNYNFRLLMSRQLLVLVHGRQFSYNGRKELSTTIVNHEQDTDLVSFIHTQTEHLTKKTVKTNQEAGFGVNVDLVNDDKFMTVIGSASPTFVMFYASWCGHCSTVKPAFSKLATTFKGEGNKVQIVAVDAAENPKTADFASIETLPTFKIFAQGQQLAAYGGDRTYESMLRFCKSFIK